MSSNKSGMDVSLLSPVSSPVPQAKRHTTANLTGDPRKIKDLAADFHNLMLKWKSLNSQGMDIISRISNIKIEKVFNVKDCDDEEGVMTLPVELSPLCDLLNDTVETMSKIETKMQHKTKITEGLQSLQQFQKSPTAHSILFSSLTVQDVGRRGCPMFYTTNTLKMIHCDFEQELKFKRELCLQVAHAESREVLMFYCASWMHEPYISPHCNDLLEALLIETGHAK